MNPTHPLPASSTFHQDPWCHNCAQAIAHKWRSCLNNADPVLEYAPFGGGRAPEGCCGALYAAMQANPEKADDIKRKFIDRCGDFRCREIKSKGKVPCKVCVDTADQLLAESLS